ncbi:MAG: hypothetical protein WDN04_03125 [Rhodospirillales bacterium]
MIGRIVWDCSHTPSRTYLTFSALFQGQTPPGGPYGSGQQSGGSGAHILKLAQQRGLPLGTFVTTGNEADVEFGEVLMALADDDDVKVILAYVEGVRARGSFLAGLARAHAARKPVVLLKVGRTESGAAAAASHTASLAGADSIYDDAYSTNTVCSVARNTEEIARRCLRRAARTPGTPVGGLGSLPYPEAWGRRSPMRRARRAWSWRRHRRRPNLQLRALCPPGSPENPVDVTAQVSTDHELMARSLEIVMASGGYDITLAFFGLYAV